MRFWRNNCQIIDSDKLQPEMVIAEATDETGAERLVLLLNYLWERK